MFINTNKNSLIFLCVCYVLCCSQISGQSIVEFQADEDLKLIGQEIEILEDANGDLKIKDILQPEYQAQFKKNDKDIFAHPATKSDFWIKFTLKNKSNNSLFLEVSSIHIWYIDFYSPDIFGEYHNPNQAGSLRPKESKYNGLFWFPPSSKEETYYLKISSGFVAIESPLYVGTYDALQEKKIQNEFLPACFMGVMIIMFLYNLFIYFSTRDPIYLSYLGYILGSSMAVSFLGNYPIIIALTDGWIAKNWWYQYYVFWSFPFPLFTGLFAIQYLQLYSRARWAFWLIVSQIVLICIIFPVMDLFIDTVYFASFFQVFVFIYGTSCVGIGIFIWLTKDKTVFFYILGWGSILISLFLFSLTINGLIPFNNTIFNITFYGVAIEVWLFSLALANRINVLRKENELLILNQNKTLEHKIAERTEELERAYQKTQVMNEELHEAYEEAQVMNEELRQTQEELQAQRDSLDIKNQQLDGFNQKIQSSLKSAETIQQAILPYKQKLEELLGDYFIMNYPKDVVSGDFYWIHKTNGKIILVVADCTGHGVPGAFMTLIGANLLDKIVKDRNIVSPSEILNLLHQEIQILLKQTHTENNSGMDAIIISLEQQDSQYQLTFSGAKNNLLIQTSKELMELKGTRKSIGGIQNERIQFENQEMKIDKGNILYLGSDGLEDQNNTKRRKFGKNKIKTIIQENYHLPLSEQKYQFEEALRVHMNETDQRDDILWMAVKV